VKREILKAASDPRVRTKCVDVIEFDDSLKQLAADIIDTIAASTRPGVGMAANQIGDLRRLFVVYDPQDVTDPAIYVNPVLIKQRGEATDVEGCLSLEESDDCEIARAKMIDFAAQDLNGKKFRGKLRSFDARVFLHELDHLDGITILDRKRMQDKEV
jgi:peptide deformylase